MHTAAPSNHDVVHRSAGLLEAVRARAPLVQCITNTVVQNVTANVLLALGASPAMVDVPTEAGPFARVADALLVNTGTPHAEPRIAALEAAAAAADSGTPWVLDPVAVGSLPVRTRLAQGLLALRPTVLRGNASEVLALLGSAGGGRGTDSTADPEDAYAAAVDAVGPGDPGDPVDPVDPVDPLGSVDPVDPLDSVDPVDPVGRTVGAVAVSGAVDLLVAPGRVVRVANGTPLLTRITGGGCALGAVVAAFTSVAPTDPGAAAVAATLVHTVAAESAAATSGGPGTFQPLFLDALAALTPEELVRSARVEVSA